MIRQKRTHVKSPKPKPKAYYAHNSRNVAGIRFGDTLRSIRGKDGILRRAHAIAWDAGVIDRAHADGITRLMVQIEGGSTYTTTIETLFANGQLQHTPAGRQRVLSLRYWSVDGQAPPASRAQLAPETQPAAQMNLFEVQE